MTAPRRDLPRDTLGVLFIGALIIAALWVLRPFVASTIWATMIVVTTWPMLRWFEARLWGRRGPAVTVMTLLLLLLVVAPLTLAIVTVVAHAEDIVFTVTSWTGRTLPPPPAWIENLPFVGDMLLQLWQQAESAGAKGLLARLAPYADDIAKWVVASAGSVGFVIVQFLMTVIIAALMYAGGESAAEGVRRFAHRLAGHAGDNVVTLAGQAIRAVALGVGVTAVVQAALGGIGLMLAGVPFGGLLTAVMLLLCVAQLGPSLVMFPAVGWLYWSGQFGWGTFLLVITLVAVTMDNFLRPILIRRGADLPLLLILAGVIGGLLAFGLIGIFVGPVLLAVTYTLLDAWIASDPDSVAAPQTPA